jgi:hypothetical protein
MMEIGFPEHVVAVNQSRDARIEIYRKIVESRVPPNRMPTCKKLRHGRSFQAHPTTGDQTQWPKNNHSKMITGIGTPSNHSNIPRAIDVLLQYPS